MKIMKVLDKKVGDTEYIKFRVNLPKQVVENSGLKDTEVKVVGEKGKIIIEKNIKEDKQELTNKEKILQKELIKMFEKQKRVG